MVRVSPLLASASGVLNKLLGPSVIDLVNHSNPTLRAMKKTPIKAGETADKLRWVVRTSHGVESTASINDYDSYVIPANLGQETAPAELGWAKYITYVEVGKQAADLLSVGQLDIFADLLRSEVNTKAKQHANAIARDLYSLVPTLGAGNGIVGLPVIADDDNIYANIDRSLAPMANFRATVLDAAGAPIGTPLFNELDQLYFDNTNEDLIHSGRFIAMTSSKVYARYLELFQSITLGALPQAHWLNHAYGGDTLGQVEFPAYGSVPIIRTPEYRTPAGDTPNTDRLYFLDMAQFELRYVPQMNSIVRGDALQGGNPGQAADGIPVKIEILPNTGESYKLAMTTHIQTQCKNPKSACAVIKNLAR
jgi:hypothetical protein